MFHSHCRFIYFSYDTLSDPYICDLIKSIKDD